MLLNHALKNLSGFKPLGIGRVPKASNKFAGPHLKQLHSRHVLITGQSQHITTHRCIGKTHLLIRCELIQTLQLIPDAGCRFEIKPLCVTLHLLM